jgi:hypothetical protein
MQSIDLQIEHLAPMFNRVHGTADSLVLESDDVLNFVTSLHYKLNKIQSETFSYSFLHTWYQGLLQAGCDAHTMFGTYSTIPMSHLVVFQ